MRATAFSRRRTTRHGTGRAVAPPRARRHAFLMVNDDEQPGKNIKWQFLAIGR